MKAEEAIWRSLRQELERWKQAGKVADFWLRDDDAVAPTPSLDRLLGLTTDFSVPVAIAVIPEATGDALAARLAEAAGATVVVHGWSHANHAPDGEKKQELGSHRAWPIVLAELAAGLERLRRLHGPRLAPILVPPWNRIDPALTPELPALGFEALSVFGMTKPTGIRVVNSNVDIMDWRGGRVGRDPAVLVEEIVLQLRRSFEDGGEAVGILTHHLDHDEGAWAFLERLFEMTARDQGCRWRSIGDRIGRPRA